MKNIKVKATRYFKDVIENVERKINDEFLVDKDRYDFLKKNNAVELIGVIVENTKKEDEEITEKQVQAVASAIVEEAEETNKTVDEVINEIVDEIVEDEKIEKAVDEIVDATVDKLFKKKGKKKNK